MSGSAVRSGVGLLAILMAAAATPQSTEDILRALHEKGLEVTPPELYPWLRRLTAEGLLAPSLQINPEGEQVRHYWITREGAKAIMDLLPVLRALAAEPR